MDDYTRPYIVIPKLINQPTWGGSKIVEMKGWGNNATLKDLVIGQSYELFSGSTFARNIVSTADELFSPEIDVTDSKGENPRTQQQAGKVESISLQELIENDGVLLLGKKVMDQFGCMPLLNKLNHSLGNSFQVHIKQDTDDPHWRPKAESWYYLSKGAVTYGLKKGTSLEAYKKTCLHIEDEMKRLSSKVISGDMCLDNARAEAQQIISLDDPHQYVNKHHPNEYELIDLSSGGVHHSWEEDPINCPEGNFLYEVQQDVMDPQCTIRAFDQGKIKDDGTIRTIHVEDYFQFIDVSEEANDINNAKKIINPDKENILQTTYYSIDVLDISSSKNYETNDTFHHLFVRDGTVKIQTPTTELEISEGHSCFIPAAVRKYTILPSSSSAHVIKTYL